MNNIPTIRVLNERTINKIKAGEVIENPASVVKELVENSLDAGATEICVEIKSGGRDLIRVTDNGCGMSQEDALLSLELHATSKISEVEDIAHLTTMGFRGEAIPSIAAISKFTLITCPQGKTPEEATLIRVEANKVISCSGAARSVGTTIEVKSLFFNVPVRRNFQRSPSYDAQEVHKRMVLFALGYPHIHFTFLSDQKSVLETGKPTSENPLAQRIESILGKEYFNAVNPLMFHKEPYRLEGVVGDPSFTRPQKTGQYLFINRRAVVSPFISFAVREAYGTMIPHLRHPVFVLHIEMPGSLFDVNVHPQKKEIRLREESRLKAILIEAVQCALHHEKFEANVFESKPLSDYSAHSDFSSRFASSFEVREEAAPFSSIPMAQIAPIPDFAGYKTQEFLPIMTQPALFDIPPVPPKKIPKVWSTLPGFIIMDPSFFGKSEGIGVIDQRSASFRIQFERLSKRKESNCPLQSLLVPIILELTLTESQKLKNHLELFHRMGIHIREFGPHTFAIDAFPVSIGSEHLQELLLNLIHDFEELHDSHQIERAEEQRILMAANRLAFSSNKKLSFEEAQHLLSQLVEYESFLYCPKGKNIFVHMSMEKIGLLFERAEK